MDGLRIFCPPVVCSPASVAETKPLATPCTMTEFRAGYMGRNYVSDYGEETVITLESIVFVYQPNDPRQRQASQATILGYADNFPSLVLFENLANTFAAGLFNRLEVIFGVYEWEEPRSGARYRRDWWAYYTTVSDAKSLRELCATPVETDYALYTFLVAASFADVCEYTFPYWVQQAVRVRQGVLSGKIPFCAPSASTPASGGAI